MTKLNEEINGLEYLYGSEEYRKLADALMRGEEPVIDGLEYLYGDEEYRKLVDKYEASKKNS